jgi:DNA-binding response OmpR family regulator
MKKRILVVDDEKSITAIIDKIASGLGHQVLTLNRPAAALETFDSFRPDILMLDIVMPDVDGIDVLRQVLARETNTRIIIMTGFGDGYLRLGQAVAEFCDHPAIATLGKPFRRIDVVALLSDNRPDAGPPESRAAA